MGENFDFFKFLIVEGKFIFIFEFFLKLGLYLFIINIELSRNFGVFIS